MDMALPGMLPVLNSSCLNKAILANLAFDGKLTEKVAFDRKHQFYADSPAGYQIT